MRIHVHVAVVFCMQKNFIRQEASTCSSPKGNIHGNAGTCMKWTRIKFTLVLCFRAVFSVKKHSM